MQLLPRLAARAVLQALVSNRQRGFILLELLVAAAIVAACAGLMLVRGSSLHRQYYKLQVRIAAQSLAADVRQLQQQALFQSEGAQVLLTVNSSDKAAYSLKSGTSVVRVVRFAALNCNGVYFNTSIARLGFSKAGNPTASGSYILKHEQLASYRCQLSVQPVTGRVSIYAKE